MEGLREPTSWLADFHEVWTEIGLVAFVVFVFTRRYLCDLESARAKRVAKKVQDKLVPGSRDADDHLRTPRQQHVSSKEKVADTSSNEKVRPASQKVEKGLLKRIKRAAQERSRTAQTDQLLEEAAKKLEKWIWCMGEGECFEDSFGAAMDHGKSPLLSDDEIGSTSKQVALTGAATESPGRYVSSDEHKMANNQISAAALVHRNCESACDYADWGCCQGDDACYDWSRLRGSMGSLFLRFAEEESCDYRQLERPSSSQHLIQAC
jgi:hypothetical protein